MPKSTSILFAGRADSEIRPASAGSSRPRTHGRPRPPPRPAPRAGCSPIRRTGFPSDCSDTRGTRAPVSASPLPPPSRPRRARNPRAARRRRSRMPEKIAFMRYISNDGSGAIMTAPGRASAIVMSWISSSEPLPRIAHQQQVECATQGRLDAIGRAVRIAIHGHGSHRRRDLRAHGLWQRER